MTQAVIQQMAARIADLLEVKLRFRGADLAEKLKRNGHRLPRKLRLSAARLAEAAQLAENPRLQRRIDMQDVSEAYDYCLRRLGRVSLWQRYGGGVVSIVLSILTSLVLLAVAVLALLRWRGYL